MIRCELCGEKAAILFGGMCSDCYDWSLYFILKGLPYTKIRILTKEDMK